MRLISIALLAIASLHSLVSAGHAAKRPPNIVFFLVDDMGWNDTQPYGNKFHETPNVVKLAKQGLRFTNAYAACPVCSPTRASIMTGRYPARVGITDFIPGHLRPWAKLVVPPIHNQLPLSEVSLAEAVKPAGYVSGSFGKWHLGGPAFFPDKQGFDDYVVTAGRHFGFRTLVPKLELGNEVPVKKDTYLADFLTDRAERFIEKSRDKPFLLYLPHYAVHIPLEAKQRLIAKYRKKAQRPEFRPNVVVTVRWRGRPLKLVSEQVLRPMMGVLPFGGHLSYQGLTQGFDAGQATFRIKDIPEGQSPDEFVLRVRALIEAARSPAPKAIPPAKGKDAGGSAPGGRPHIDLPPAIGTIDVRLSPVNNPTYAAMVEHIDQSLGRIMKKLDDLKLADNTVVIFFSDNGGLYRRFDGKGEAVTSNHPLRDEKGSLYEGGIREPCIIRWPGVVKPGTTSDVPITSVDFCPTIAEIAGTRAKFKHTIDGVSLLPVLKPDSGDLANPRNLKRLKDRALYWHYPHYHHTAPGGAIRYGDYKLIEYFEDGKLELYNLKRDIGEATDLSQSQPEKTKQLHAMLKAWRKSVGAKMPTRNPHHDPKRAGEWRRRGKFKRKPAKN